MSPITVNWRINALSTGMYEIQRVGQNHALWIGWHYPSYEDVQKALETAHSTLEEAL